MRMDAVLLDRKADVVEIADILFRQRANGKIVQFAAFQFISKQRQKFTHRQSTKSFTIPIFKTDRPGLYGNSIGMRRAWRIRWSYWRKRCKSAISIHCASGKLSFVNVYQRRSDAMGEARMREHRMTLPARHAGCWPAAILLIAGMLAPIAVVLYVSLCRPLDFGGVAWASHSLDAYVGLIFEHDFDGNTVFRSAYPAIFLRSFLFASATTLLCVLTGLPTALFIATQKASRRTIFLLLVIAPFAISLVVRAYGWVILLADGGLVNQGLNALLDRPGASGILYSNTATMIGLVSIFFPFMVLPIYATLREFDWETAEAAATLGASPAAVLRRVVIPACMPGVRAGIALVFVPALGAYVVPDLLGGAKSMMVGNLVQLAFTSDRNWPLGAALSVALIGLVGLVAWFARRAPLIPVRGAGGRDSHATYPGVAWIALPMLAFLYAPILALVVTSFYAGPSALVWQGFAMDGYAQVLADENLLRAASTSFCLAGLTVAIVTVVAVAAAIGIGDGSAGIARLFEQVLKIPLIVPEIVLAIATLLGFAALSIELNFLTVLFAHAVFCLPVAYLPIRASVQKIDRDLLDAAATLSATPFQTFRSVTLPLIWPGIMTGAILSFVTSLDDFVTTYFVAGAGVITLPTYLYGALKVGVSPKISAISTIVIVASALLVIAGAVLNRRRQHRDGKREAIAPALMTTPVRLARGIE
ncbi:ABC transporter permease subunit [Burkholderia stagnalis]|uniref:ABC transporter permease subunit n=1 Tax=Burkholderia stagnalis TaxID=1503054 RepID=UPI001E335133|nr:ABC transporter permease subunit [Burkholderia stagnalis]